MAVRTARTERGTAQETLANLAGIERSHMGKIERGEHMPNLAMILRIARALNRSASELIAATENNLQTAANATERKKRSSRWPLARTEERRGGEEGVSPG